MWSSIVLGNFGLKFLYVVYGDLGYCFGSGFFFLLRSVMGYFFGCGKYFVLEVVYYGVYNWFY